MPLYFVQRIVNSNIVITNVTKRMDLVYRHVMGAVVSICEHFINNLYIYFFVFYD